MQVYRSVLKTSESENWMLSHFALIFSAPRRNFLDQRSPTTTFDFWRLRGVTGCPYAKIAKSSMFEIMFRAGSSCPRCSPPVSEWTKVSYEGFWRDFLCAPSDVHQIMACSSLLHHENRRYHRYRPKSRYIPDFPCFERYKPLRTFFYFDYTSRETFRTLSGSLLSA